MSRRAKEIEALILDLGFEVPIERKRDALDFHEVHVGSLRRALERAYEAGWAAGAEVGAAAHAAK